MSVYNYALKSNLNPIYKSISKSYIAADMAQKLEEKTIEIYEQSGWVILNKAKAGELGLSDKKWTYESYKQAALQCKTRIEFRSRFGGALSKASAESLYE